MIPQHINNSINNTVGYSEAENKESFKVGASVAFYFAEKHYEQIIEHLEKQIIQLRAAVQDTRDDITTIVEIFDKYRSE